jgi:hypothetical protein
VLGIAQGIHATYCQAALRYETLPTPGKLGHLRNSDFIQPVPSMKLSVKHAAH